MKADEANYREAQALIAEARAQLFPTLDFDPSLTRASSVGGLRRASAPQVERELDARLWGKVRRTIESKSPARR